MFLFCFLFFILFCINKLSLQSERTAMYFTFIGLVAVWLSGCFDLNKYKQTEGTKQPGQSYMKLTQFECELVVVRQSSEREIDDGLWHIKRIVQSRSVKCSNINLSKTNALK